MYDKIHYKLKKKIKIKQQQQQKQEQKTLHSKNEDLGIQSHPLIAIVGETVTDFIFLGSNNHCR